MASGSRRPRQRFIDIAEVIEEVLNSEDSPEGISSGEESDLDRQLYDVDGDQRY